MKHKLEQIFKKFNIQHISSDSRDIVLKSAFFAMRGSNFNGNDFLSSVLNEGASIAFTDDESKIIEDKIFYLSDIRMALAIAADILYPSESLEMIGVTGTNGKSSVVSYVHQILSLLGKNSACMGTLGIECNIECNIESYNKNNNKTKHGLTTAGLIEFKKSLHNLAKHNVKYVAFEASSHGLHQKRMGNIKVKSAAFTSFSRDHLDYHQTMKNYLDAKLDLFLNNLEKDGDAVINIEMQNFEYVQKFLEDNNITHTTVGRNGDIQIISNDQNINHQNIVFKFQDKIYEFQTEIIGSFQAINLLIAAKLVYNLAIDFEQIVSVLPKLKSVCGRLQRITDKDEKYHIFVDYAHTPDALQQSLTELKKLKNSTGKLHVIFGCGGDRDKSKRPIMGRIASEIADKVIITDDNPRTENADAIRNEIFVGAGVGDLIDDRKKAIIDTINILKEHDILLIAGKGHEDYQIIGTETIKFSDIEIAQYALNNKII
ncbi:MAG: UDP-N-acetylmuramoyl-L-alanyl-D-glutamate--2,6-diaminopimelate ligase [Rickettsiales bacterium]|nr:MAG: UDP-N-acetylmuramoyl-L-alanyl-D-glutamate--2,6-diaminopimelate ligase [Rickettsiales bacterium]